MKRFLLYALMLLMVIAGTYCVTSVYTDSKAKSITIGEAKYSNSYDNFNIYSYDLSEEFFYLNEDTKLYELVKDYSVKSDFDGTAKKYNLVFNNQPCYSNKTSAGTLYGEFNISYSGLDNEYIGTTKLTINLSYYIDSIKVKITAENNEHYGKFLNYLKLNGIKLNVIEGQLDSNQTESTTFNGYYIKFVDASGFITSIHYYSNEGEVSAEFFQLLSGSSETEANADGTHTIKYGWSDGTNTYSQFYSTDFNSNVDLVEIVKYVNYVKYYTLNSSGEYEQFGSKYDQEHNTTHTYPFFYNPDLDGYEFKGWSLDKTNIVNPTGMTISSDTNFYAVFDEIDNSPVVFNGLTLNALVKGGYIITSSQQAGVAPYIFSINSTFSSLSEGVLTIPEGFKFINISGNLNFENVLGLILPSTISGGNAYSHFPSLSSLVLSEGFVNADVAFGNINESCYSIFDGLKYLGTSDNPYYFCVDVVYPKDTSVTVRSLHPDCVLLGTYPFFYSTFLTTIDLNSNLKVIADKAFMTCNSLTNIVIPSSVVKIGMQAFENCTALTTIFIPASVTDLCSQAFNNCTSLKIYCEAAEKPSGWHTNCFNSVATENISYGITYDQYLNLIS